MRRMFKRTKKEEKEELVPDITSLLDILVIMLFFLLHSYNASDLSIDLVPGLDLAGSSTTDLGHRAIVIQVNKDKKVFVDNEEVKGATFADEKIEALYNRLEEMKPVTLDRKVASTDSKEKPVQHDPRPINIVLDEDAPYMIMQKVMHTVSLAGFDEIKLIVGIKGEG